MTAFRKTAFIFMSLFLLLSLIEAGPLSLSLSRSRFRNGREIRAPFKNQEIMVARGFGKRDVQNRPQKIENPLDDLVDAESIPLEWLTKELLSNPSLTRLILHRFVDTNKDDVISERELLPADNQMENSDLY